MYRRLITLKRTYAGYDYNMIVNLGETLKDKKEIFDPMSGYGTLMIYCANNGKKSYSVEINPPAYLWQILMHPKNKNIIINIITKFLSKEKEWKKPSCRAECSDEWFTEESFDIIASLYDCLVDITREYVSDQIYIEQIALAILLPFVSRLSTSINGDITHIKKGGICIYYNYKEDLKFYLNKIRMRLEENSYISNEHTVILGDCREEILPQKRFSAMITSPPYPNYRDYYKMFWPENFLLESFKQRNIIRFEIPKGNVIGTNAVKGREVGEIENPIVNDFLSNLSKYKGTKKAEKANERYYVPYFRNYFYDMERAYENIAKSLSDSATGYIIVSNNTVRNLIVPVAESVIYKWREMGFYAEEISKEEKFHIGTKNPYSRGLKAKHAEYIIKVWR